MFHYHDGTLPTALTTRMLSLILAILDVSIELFDHKEACHVKRRESTMDVVDHDYYKWHDSLVPQQSNITMEIHWELASNIRKVVLLFSSVKFPLPLRLFKTLYVFYGEFDRCVTTMH